MFRSIPVKRLTGLVSATSEQIIDLKLVARHRILHPNHTVLATARRRCIHIRFSPVRLVANPTNGQTPPKHGDATPKALPRGRSVPPIKMVVRETLGGFRNMVNMFRLRNLKALFKKHPISMTGVVFVYLFVFYLLGYTIWFTVGYAYNRFFTKWPEEIAFSLRKAMFYSFIRPNHQLALKHWGRALEQCADHNMDGFSDDVLGIRVAIAEYLEGKGDLSGSLQILMAMRKDILRWLEKFDKEVEAGKIGDGVVEWTFIYKDIDGNTVNEKTVLPGDKEYPEHLENLWAKRQRLWLKNVQISVKMAELYASPHVMEPEKATQELELAVENTLKEVRRREVEGVRKYEGDYADLEQVGASFERLALHMEGKGRFELALPLLLQALPLCKDPCHSATIMNNMATCFFQYPPYLPNDAIVTGVVTSQTDPSTNAAPEPKKALVVAARNWAKNALELSTETVKSEYFMEKERKDKCTLCAMMANLNLAEITERMGNATKAGKLYRTVLDEPGLGGIASVVALGGPKHKEETKEARKRAYDGLERVKAAKEAIREIKKEEGASV